MMANKPLPREFFAQDARIVARELIGVHLIREIDGRRIIGRIVETEAYTGHDDLASHGRERRTPRNIPMWETPGHAYVYLIYGLYWLLNVVCEPAGAPAAVLIRALEPIEGQDIIAENRGGAAARYWTNGPGRLTRALQISGTFNQHDLTSTSGGLWIAPGEPVPDSQITTGARIGLGRHVTEPWLSIPWRWWIPGNPHVSK